MDIPDKRVADLLCCGFEGGVGWCIITDYKAPEAPRSEWRSVWGEGEIFPHVDFPLLGGAVLCELVDPCDEDELVLDRKACERGLRVMSKKYPRHWGNFLAENEDAETGDVFIQCALLGEVIYG